MDDTATATSTATAGSVKKVDGAHKMMIAGQLLPSTLLSRSATEFDLECETDAVYETGEKHVQPVDNSAAVVSSATGLMSGGILVAQSSSDSVDVEADITDCSAVLDTSAASGTKVCTEDVLPHLKHKKNYNTKVSCIVYI